MRCSTLRKSPMVRTSQGGRWCPMWNPPPGDGPWLLGSHLATIWPLGWWKQSIAIGWPMKKHCTRKIIKNPIRIFPDVPIKSHGTVVGLPANWMIISAFQPQFQPRFTHWVPDDFFIRLSPIAPALGFFDQMAVEGSADPHPPTGCHMGVTPIAGWKTWKMPFKKKNDENEWWISACSCNSKLMFHVIV